MSEGSAAPDAIATLLRQLDDAWAHPWESVAFALKDVTEEEAAWQPPVYAEETNEEGWPPKGSVRWHVAHLAACKRDYACLVRDRGKAAEGCDPFEPAASYADDMAQLNEAHAWLRREIAAMTPEDLLLTLNEKTPADEFIAATIRHDAWHAGQVLVARRMYRMR